MITESEYDRWDQLELLDFVLFSEFLVSFASLVFEYSCFIYSPSDGWYCHGSYETFSDRDDLRFVTPCVLFGQPE